MEILLKEDNAKGFAMARENDKRIGMMTYSIAGADLIIIDHTEVEPAYNGKSVGKQMLYKNYRNGQRKKQKDYSPLSVRSSDV